MVACRRPRTLEARNAFLSCIHAHHDSSFDSRTHALVSRSPFALDVQMADHPDAKRARLMTDLRAVRGCTRTALSTILDQLHTTGALNIEVGANPRNIRDRMSSAVSASARRITPYGPLVDNFECGAEKNKLMPYVNPFAFLHTLAVESSVLF